MVAIKVNNLQKGVNCYPKYPAKKCKLLLKYPREKDPW